MPTFSYTARDREGNISTGSAAARDLEELRSSLRARDLFLTKVQQVADQSLAQAPSVQRVAGRRRVGLGDMVVMSRQLATLVRAGIPIVDAVHNTAAQTESEPLARALQEVRLDVLSGLTLSEAMAKHPRIFSELYVTLVRAGEAGGVLEDTLETAAIQFDREAELREKVKAAAVYPAIVVIVAVLVVIFMLTFIVPVFAQVYQQFRAELPPITRMLVEMSKFLQRFWWVGLLVIAAVTYALRRYAISPAGRLRYDQFKLKMPLFGKLNRKIAIARFTRTLSAVMKAGVPILQALSISASTSGNQVIMLAVERVTQFVKEGASLAVTLAQTGEFPPMVSRMVAAGEQSGNLDEMLEQVTRFYDRDIEYTVSRLTRLLEPLMTVIVGGIVLFVLLALYMPIFNLSRVLRK